ncbi:MAG: PilZ domain-containing protein [Planctomycetota bacterium]|nr:PilZ domain-containing protein [Planctomycetota bacterium]
MLRVDERRRHQRDLLTCPVALRDMSGRVLFRGRAADIAPGGIRIMGKGGRPLEEGQPVWVELTLPRCRSSGQRTRIVKVSGEVRRVEVMGEWRSVIVIIFDTEFNRMALDPTL